MRHIITTAFVLLAATVGCSDLAKLTGTTSLPAGTSDPKILRTPQGALAAYRSAVAAFEFVTYSAGEATSGLGGSVSNGAFLNTVLMSGQLTDELEPNELGGSPTDYFNVGSSTFGLDIDARSVRIAATTGRIGNLYLQLQGIRIASAQGIGALEKYAPNTSPALRGHLYALNGYAEILLADLFCSGVPLSQFQFEGDFVYQPGSTTEEIYRHAITQFDTALSLSPDSVRIMHLARVGKGRALLDLGEYAEAAAAVQDVPDGYRYQFPVGWGMTGQDVSIFRDRWGQSVADREGINGLPFRSANDPRTAVVSAGDNQYGATRYFPAKYGSPDDITPISVASGIEARLIVVEKLLKDGSAEWLTQLNALRTNGTFTVTTNPENPDQVDTTWHAGIGGVEGLPRLKDPGSDTGRVSVLFRERAFWLYLTGHRQGDLRRMIRQYHRLQEDIYPIGEYPVFGAFPTYGNDVNLPVSEQERVNPHFKGCLNREA